MSTHRLHKVVPTKGAVMDYEVLSSASMKVEITEGFKMSIVLEVGGTHACLPHVVGSVHIRPAFIPLEGILELLVQNPPEQVFKLVAIKPMLVTAEHTCLEVEIALPESIDMTRGYDIRDNPDAFGQLLRVMLDEVDVWASPR